MDEGAVGQGRDIPSLGMGSTEGNVVLTPLQCPRMQQKQLPFAVLSQMFWLRQEFLQLSSPLNVF